MLEYCTLIIHGFAYALDGRSYKVDRFLKAYHKEGPVQWGLKGAPLSANMSSRFRVARMYGVTGHNMSLSGNRLFCDPFRY